MTGYQMSGARQSRTLKAQRGTRHASTELPMKYWARVAPDHVGRPDYEVVSEAAIIARYYHSWVEKCKASCVPGAYTHDKCVQDWVAAHWAFKVKDPDLVVIERGK